MTRLYDNLCNHHKLNKQLNRIRQQQIKNLEKNSKNFSSEQIPAKNGDHSKIAFYYTKKNGEKVLVACRDFNSNLVRFYIAKWTVKYASIYRTLRDYCESSTVHSFPEFIEVSDIQLFFDNI